MADENDLAEDSELLPAINTAQRLLPILYKDLASEGGIKELGKTVKTLAGLINLLLTPVEVLVWGGKKGKEKLSSLLRADLETRLRGIPLRRLRPPHPMFAGPLLERYQYMVNEPDLSQLFANLLAKGMDEQTVMEAHPAFVEIISQITPDEARILKYFHAKDSSAPVITLRSNDKAAHLAAGFEVFKNFSHIGLHADITHHNWTTKYLDNLCRLGLMEIPLGPQLVDEAEYIPLEADGIIRETQAAIKESGRFSRIVRGFISLTQFGVQFCKTCLDEPKA